MNNLRLLIVVSLALVTSLSLTQARAEVPRLQIQPNGSAPLILNGISGGVMSTNCGNIAQRPNQILQLTEPLPYLRVTVDSPGQPTILIDGPGGRFCVIPDNYSETKPEITGYWQAGEYSLYVGDLSQNQYNYTISISQDKKSNK
jgi:hypothetical protein